MDFEDSNRHGILRPEVLANYIQANKINLPEDYQQYLLAHNGGIPKPKDFLISEKEGGSGIHVMYGLNNGSNWQSLKENRLTFQRRMPSSVTPIGCDDFGNQIVICCNGKHRESVWFWDHEQEASWYRRWSNIIQIAGSWTEFLDTLFEYIDPDETEWEKMIRSRDHDLLNQYIRNNEDWSLSDQFGRTLVENCAVAAADDFILALVEAGAQLGKSLELAEKNVKFGSEKHKKTVDLIKSLS